MQIKSKTLECLKKISLRNQLRNSEIYFIIPNKIWSFKHALLELKRTKTL